MEERFRIDGELYKVTGNFQNPVARVESREELESSLEWLEQKWNTALTEQVRASEELEALEGPFTYLRRRSISGRIEELDDEMDRLSKGIKKIEQRIESTEHRLGYDQRK